MSLMIPAPTFTPSQGVEVWGLVTRGCLRVPRPELQAEQRDWPPGDGGPQGTEVSAVVLTRGTAATVPRLQPECQQLSCSAQPLHSLPTCAPALAFSRQAPHSRDGLGILKMPQWRPELVGAAWPLERSGRGDRSPPSCPRELEN